MTKSSALSLSRALSSSIISSEITSCRRARKSKAPVQPADLSQRCISRCWVQLPQFSKHPLYFFLLWHGALKRGLELLVTFCSERWRDCWKDTTEPSICLYAPVDQDQDKGPRDSAYTHHWTKISDCENSAQLSFFSLCAGLHHSLCERAPPS